MGSLRVGHDWATSLWLFTFMHWKRKWQPTPVFLPGESRGQRSLVGCRLWGRTESDMTEATQQQQQQQQQQQDICSAGSSCSFSSSARSPLRPGMCDWFSPAPPHNSRHTVGISYIVIKWEGEHIFTLSALHTRGYWIWGFNQLWIGGWGAEFQKVPKIKTCLLPASNYLHSIDTKGDLRSAGGCVGVICRYYAILGFPGGSEGKESTCQFRRHKRHRFNPWVRKIPWRRKWQPTPVLLPGKVCGQRSLVGYSPWGHKRVRHDLATKQQTSWPRGHVCTCLQGGPTWLHLSLRPHVKPREFLISLLFQNFSFCRLLF